MLIYHLGNIFTFLGGIGMFLFGMSILSEGLQKITGTKFNNILKTLTNSKLMGILIGTIVTAVLHSSAATTVMVVGLVNANILNLEQALGVIMGANIGTTVTSWLVSLVALGNSAKILDPNFYAPLLIGIASIYMLFNKNEKAKTKVYIAIGIGLLFIGINYMSTGIKVYTKTEEFINLFRILGKNPVLALLLGLIVTAIIQSSTASVSILQTLALNGEVSKSAAVFITLGQNIGTCVIALLSSTKTNTNGKRTAIMHLLFNVIGAIICILLIFVLYPLISNYLNSNISVVEISIFHTLFNVTNTLILLPFSKYIINLTKKIIKDESKQIEDVNLSDELENLLDYRILNQPSLAIDDMRNAVVKYAKFTIDCLNEVSNELISFDKNKKINIDKFRNNEIEIDKIKKMLTKFSLKINISNVTKMQHMMVENMSYMCSDIERIGDHIDNLVDIICVLEKDKLSFSKQAKIDLKEIYEKTKISFENAINTIKYRDMNYIAKTIEYETIIDELVVTYRDIHIKRLEKGNCSVAAGICFTDCLGNYERISDHSRNIVSYIKAELDKN